MAKKISVYLNDEVWEEAEPYRDQLNLSALLAEAVTKRVAELKRAEVHQQAASLGQATASEYIAQSPVEAQETLAKNGGVLPVPATLGSIVLELTHDDPNLKSEFFSGWRAGTISAWQQAQASTVQQAQPGAVSAMKFEPQVARVARLASEYADQIERDSVEAIKRLQDEDETKRISGRAKPSAAGA